MKEIPVIDICICTYRRPHLVETLRSLSQIVRPDGVTLRVVVADNDITPSAAATVESCQSEDLPITYIHAPARNISVARNACLNHATGRFIAWIDDDETVDKLWLFKLFHTLVESKYDAVFGPAVAIYPTDAPAHIARGDFHSNRPVTRNGDVQTGHTCNALVDMSQKALRAQRFDLSKGRTGGEDTDYFYRLWREGATFGICDDALVYEDVAPSRLRPAWLLRRSFNSGHVFGEISRRGAARLTYLRLLLLATLKACVCLIATLLNLASATKRLWWVRRGAMHLGVIAGLVQITPKAQY
jgi:succinoglycan biosynthesis protein ExoM